MTSTQQYLVICMTNTQYSAVLGAKYDEFSVFLRNLDNTPSVLCNNIF